MIKIEVVKVVELIKRFSTMQELIKSTRWRRNCAVTKFCMPHRSRNLFHTRHIVISRQFVFISTRSIIISIITLITFFYFLHHSHYILINFFHMQFSFACTLIESRYIARAVNEAARANDRVQIFQNNLFSDFLHDFNSSTSSASKRVSKRFLNDITTDANNKSTKKSKKLKRSSKKKDNHALDRMLLSIFLRLLYFFMLLHRDDEKSFFYFFFHSRLLLLLSFSLSHDSFRRSSLNLIRFSIKKRRKRKSWRMFYAIWSTTRLWTWSNTRLIQNTSRLTQKLTRRRTSLLIWRVTSASFSRSHIIRWSASSSKKHMNHVMQIKLFVEEIELNDVTTRV